MTEPQSGIYGENNPFWYPRQIMVQDQLQARGIVDSRVLEVMRTVPREEFIPPVLREKAYDDGPLPIACGQTISQPYIVALMVEALELDGTEKVLEIGTGSGYESAILSQLASKVISIERIPELGQQAHEDLLRLGYQNVDVRTGDGTLGFSEEAPYDAIIVTAGGHEFPEPLAEQIREGGRIVIPLGSKPSTQYLYRYRKESGILKEENLGRVLFVPLIGEHGWSPGP